MMQRIELTCMCMWQMSEAPKSKGAVTAPFTGKGSGGYAKDTTGEERSHQWAVEADNDPALEEAVGGKIY